MRSGRRRAQTTATLQYVAPAAAGLALALLTAVSGRAVLRLADGPGPEVELAGYITSLRGRSPSQVHNARLAAAALDGVVVPPRAVFSFNRSVRSWSADQGYVKAPVSYDGELVRAFGGGVCQTSTTLYNAALLAGMEIVERHHHVFAPRYIAPGRDAAVAYPTIDLRFRNPYPWAVRLRASARGERLEIRLLGRERPAARCELVTQVLSVTDPARLTASPDRGRGGNAGAYARSPGLRGYRVVTWRASATPGGQTRRERLSDDTYPALDRTVQLPDGKD